MKMDVHFSSATPEWATPQEFFDALDAEFNFSLDACATRENAKCDLFLSKEAGCHDGLTTDWVDYCRTWKQPATIWMNPPYGREIGQWMRKAYEQGQRAEATVVCLVPARTDTAWWHDYASKGEVRFIRGRLKFGGHENSAPFPSAVVIFKP